LDAGKPHTSKSPNVRSLWQHQLLERYRGRVQNLLYEGMSNVRWKLVWFLSRNLERLAILELAVS
jgi:hypothetical protein